jgi:hypothetical protein
MRAIVNPFLRTVTIINQTIQFDDLDEWSSFTMDGRHYEIHFFYDDKFELSVYAIDFDGEVDYNTNLIKKVIYDV